MIKLEERKFDGGPETDAFGRPEVLINSLFDQCSIGVFDGVCVLVEEAKWRNGLTKFALTLGFAIQSLNFAQHAPRQSQIQVHIIDWKHKN